eukprot:COSAG01_NODE_9616_length_2388_cov_3.183923_1_plen_24_part_10
MRAHNLGMQGRGGEGWRRLCITSA